MEAKLNNLILLKNTKVILFGTGSASEIISSNLSMNIEYYVDNDCSKWGSKFNGKIVKSPEELKYNNKNGILVIIASMFVDEIAMQLEEMGFEESINYINGMELYEQICLNENRKADITGAGVSLGIQPEQYQKTRATELIECKWATYKELIEFMEKGYIKEENLGENYWGLKGFGNGYVFKQISQVAGNESLKVLDVGGGYSTLGAVLADKFNSESWLADDFGVESKEKMWTVGLAREQLKEKNKNIRYVFERLGNIENSSLPLKYFDIVYSVSALEHVPMQSLPSVFNHMLALLKPKGLMIHTIDLDEKKFRLWKEFLDSYCFTGISHNKISSIRGLNGTGNIDEVLVEPFNIVYKYYYRGNNDVEKKYRRFGSLCLVIRAM